MGILKKRSYTKKCIETMNFRMLDEIPNHAETVDKIFCYIEDHIGLSIIARHRLKNSFDILLPCLLMIVCSCQRYTGCCVEYILIFYCWSMKHRMLTLIFYPRYSWLLQYSTSVLLARTYTRSACC